VAEVASASSLVDGVKSVEAEAMLVYPEKPVVWTFLVMGSSRCTDASGTELRRITLPREAVDTAAFLRTAFGR